MSLTVKILGDASHLQKTAHAVEKRVAQLGKSIGSSLGNQFTKLAGAFAAIWSAQKVFGALEETANWADNLHDMAMQTGVAAGELLKLEAAFATAGIGIKDASRLLSVFTGNLQEAQEGPSQSRDALNRLGFLAPDFKDKGPLEAFDMIANRVRELGLTIPELTRIVEQLFGARMGYGMIRLFRDPQAFASVRSEMEKMANLVDTTGERVGIMADKWELAKFKMRGFWLGILGGLDAGGVIDKLGSIDWAGIGASIGKTAMALAEILSAGKLGALFGNFVQDLTDVFQASADYLGDVIGSAITKAIPGIKDIEPPASFKEKLQQQLPGGNFRTNRNIEATLQSIDKSTAATVSAVKQLNRDFTPRFA